MAYTKHTWAAGEKIKSTGGGNDMAHIETGIDDLYNQDISIYGVKTFYQAAVGATSAVKLASNASDANVELWSAGVKKATFQYDLSAAAVKILSATTVAFRDGADTADQAITCLTINGVTPDLHAARHNANTGPDKLSTGGNADILNCLLGNAANNIGGTSEKYARADHQHKIPLHGSDSHANTYQRFPGFLMSGTTFTTFITSGSLGSYVGYNMSVAGNWVYGSISIPESVPTVLLTIKALFYVKTWTAGQTAVMQCMIAPHNDVSANAAITVGTPTVSPVAADRNLEITFPTTVGHSPGYRQYSFGVRVVSSTITLLVLVGVYATVTTTP